MTCVRTEIMDSELSKGYINIREEYTEMLEVTYLTGREENK